MIRREVVREPAFDESAEAVFGSIVKADAYLAIVEWTLARVPDLNEFPLVVVSELGVIRAITTEPRARCRR